MTCLFYCTDSSKFHFFRLSFNHYNLYIRDSSSLH
jgi:hypothetical protein